MQKQKPGKIHKKRIKNFGRKTIIMAKKYAHPSVMFRRNFPGEAKSQDITQSGGKRPLDEITRALRHGRHPTAVRENIIEDAVGISPTHAPYVSLDQKQLSEWCGKY